MDRIVTRLLPRAATLRPIERRVLVGLFGLLAVMLAVSGLNLIVRSRAVTNIGDDWSSPVVYGLVAVLVAYRAFRSSTKRLALVMFSLALGLYGLGYVVWTFWIGQMRQPPIPSVCDLLWLSFYPLTFTGLVLFVRTPWSLRAVIDGVIVGSTVAAVGAMLVLGPILDSASGPSLAVLTEIAYPIGDVLLVALVIGVLNLDGWRLNRMLCLLAVGFLLLAAADCAYALQVSHGASQPTQLLDLVYLVGAAVLALAVWQPSRDGAPLRTGPAVAVPVGFASVALGLLLYDHVSNLNPLAYGLAVTALLASIARMALTFHDVRILAEARRQAGTDDLTSLVNRRLFIRRLEEAIRVARLAQGRVTLLVLDLDNFKQLNDTLGHLAGDTLLQLIGPRIRRVLRGEVTLARLGGDEFAVLLAPGSGADGAERVAARIGRALEQPFIINGLALRVTASIGIASHPEDGDDIEDLLKHADIAMYEAKSSRSGHAFYAADRDTYSWERLMIANELAEAIKHGELEVEFQPQADPLRVIKGAEALVRWRRSDGLLMPPAEFLPVAEQVGLSRPLTRCVLNAALDELCVWRAAGHELNVAVNTTLADLLDEHFPEEVEDALAARGIPAQALTLELTETTILSDPVRIGNVLGRLDRLGVCLSLDDFGTGFSSLEHLRSMPVGELKIDRSFVSRILVDPTDAAIVRATALLASELGIRIVAEGVEDDQTWATLADLGCALLQGYAFSRPVSAAAFRALLPAGPVGAAVSLPARQISPAPSAIPKEPKLGTAAVR
jgi:diguanylate cyclase (GGDEF)-like protein